MQDVTLNGEMLSQSDVVLSALLIISVIYRCCDPEWRDVITERGGTLCFTYYKCWLQMQAETLNGEMLSQSDVVLSALLIINVDYRCCDPEWRYVLTERCGTRCFTHYKCWLQMPAVTLNGEMCWQSDVVLATLVILNVDYRCCDSEWRDVLTERGGTRCFTLYKCWLQMLWPWMERCSHRAMWYSLLYSRYVLITDAVTLNGEMFSQSEVVPAALLFINVDYRCCDPEWRDVLTERDGTRCFINVDYRY